MEVNGSTEECEEEMPVNNLVGESERKKAPEIVLAKLPLHISHSISKMIIPTVCGIPVSVNLQLNLYPQQ
ncbi:hypothetical protein NPIL_151731 [Nephila pilipes]|uniref:Uncharacterized protein n=1 Tax=Nephila pilipes TaxID=299642 RepID=A0A8X6P6R9_NEPPI|nr:hypothetical protein NPIL_151731 [Nephila pilipes]